MWRMGGRHSYANYPPMTSSPSTAPPPPTIYRRFSSTSSWARLRGCYWWQRKWLTGRGSWGFDSCVYWSDKYFSYLSFTPVSEAVYKRFIEIGYCQCDNIKLCWTMFLVFGPGLLLDGQYHQNIKTYSGRTRLWWEENSMHGQYCWPIYKVGSTRTLKGTKH